MLLLSFPRPHFIIFWMTTERDDNKISRCRRERGPGPRGDPGSSHRPAFSLAYTESSDTTTPARLLRSPSSRRAQPEPHRYLFLIYLIQRPGCTIAPTPAEEISIIISEWYDWIRSHGEIKGKQSSRGERWKWKERRWDCELVWMKGYNNFASISFADPISLGLDYTVIPMPKERLIRPIRSYVLCLNVRSVF